MRAPLATAALAVTLLACGDSNEPNKNVFPAADGVYNVAGFFDGVSGADAHFEGTLTLTQASRESGILGGSAAFVATIGGDIFNLTDDAIDGANVSATGVITFALTEGSDSWTFSGTLSGNTITSGRHTLSAGNSTVSGAWSATKAAGSIVQGRVARGRSTTLDGLVNQLVR